MVSVKPFEISFALYSISGLELRESSSKVTIEFNVESLYDFITSYLIRASLFIVPLYKLSPFCLKIGIDSPVRLDSSKEPSPLTIFPSTQTFSPDLISTISPTLILFNAIDFLTPFSTIVASKGIELFILSRVSTADFFSQYF